MDGVPFVLTMFQEREGEMYRKRKRFRDRTHRDPALALSYSLMLKIFARYWEKKSSKVPRSSIRQEDNARRGWQLVWKCQHNHNPNTASEHPRLYEALLSPMRLAETQFHSTIEASLTARNLLGAPFVAMQI